MPKRRVTAKQRAASKRNLVKARAAKKTGNRGKITVKIGQTNKTQHKALIKSLRGDSVLLNTVGYTAPRPIDRIAVAYSGGKAVGAMQGMKVKGTFVVDLLYNSQKRKAPKGTGTILMKAAAKQATGRGLVVPLAVPTAVGFYKKTGGSTTGEGLHYQRFDWTAAKRKALAGKKIRGVQYKSF